MEHILEKAAQLGIEHCFVSGWESPRADVKTVWDIYPDRGPLGGIHACMKAMTTPYCLILPVDAPKMPVAILEELLSAHEQRSDDKVLLWEHGTRQEPLIAVWPTAMADHI